MTERAAAKMKVEFGAPSHGWVPMTIRAGDEQLETVLSNVPHDPVASIVNACVDLMVCGRGEARCSLEPGFLRVELHGVAPNDVDVCVFDEAGARLFRWRGPVEIGAGAFWRAARRLQSVRAAPDEHWGGLPASDIDRLGALLRQARLGSPWPSRP